MKKICLLGANGQLGTELSSLFKASNEFDCTRLTFDDLDIVDSNDVRDYFKKNIFDFVINCAAYTAVDLAESETDLNDAVNNIAVKHLAEACKTQDSILIQISTDFVFDGTKSIPLSESEATNPIQEYGRAKLAGEKWLDEGIVIRTSWLYSPYGNNFVKTMLRLGRERDQLNVVWDQVGTPTYAHDLAQAIAQICLDEKINEKLGVYHFSNEGLASWYDFAQGIMEYGQVNCEVFPIPDTSYPTPAKRPKYSVLDKRKIKETFNLRIPYWRASLKECMNRIKEYES